MTPQDRIRTLDPAHFSTLWEACTRCFYLAIVSGFPRPHAEMPAGVRGLATRIRAQLAGRRTETLAPGMPAGLIEDGGRKVQSAPVDVQVPEGILRCVFQGDLDLVVRGDDGRYTIVELAFSEPDDAELAAATRRMHAYAHALEREAEVTGLGIVRFEASNGLTDGVGVAGRLHWQPIPRDEFTFFGFLAEALTLLERPVPPAGTPLCPWCVYRDVSRRTGL